MKRTLFHTCILSFCALALIASVYAVVSTTSVISAMKAAEHDFSLTSDLNSGQTGLKSGPLSGKKVNDYLSSSEYNRVLEVLAQGNNPIESCTFPAYEADCSGSACSGDAVGSSFELIPKAASNLGQSAKVKVACKTGEQLISGYAYSIGEDEAAEESVNPTNNTVTCRATSFQATDDLHFTCGAICIKCGS